MTLFGPKTHRAAGADQRRRSASARHRRTFALYLSYTGTDDALAILYALHHPELEVLGISCVAGNVPIEQVVINTCKVLDAAGAGSMPVAAGVLACEAVGPGRHGA